MFILPCFLFCSYSAVVTLAHNSSKVTPNIYLVKHFVIIALGFGIAYVFHKNKIHVVFSKWQKLGFSILLFPFIGLLHY